MNTRREFLLRVFALLDERDIPFVVLRNFEAVFEPTGGDVDLLAVAAEPIFAAAQTAAEETGHRLVQKARFINHSWVWWDGRFGFTRVDVDTSIRWRAFEAVSTRSVLACRVRHGSFWVPDARHEAIALRSNVANRGFSEERYTTRLATLGEAARSPKRERWELVRRNLAHPGRWARVAGFVLADLWRYIDRWRNPPGHAITASTDRADELEQVKVLLDPVFPKMLRARSEEPASIRRALFKAGLGLRLMRGREDGKAAVKDASRSIGTKRHTVVVTGSKNDVHCADLENGWMLSARFSNAEELCESTAKFICESRARNLENPSVRRGVTVLLVGLDGSGKSTLARNLLQRAMRADRFSGCTYFHWIPPLDGSADFPWPATGDQPRHRGVPGKVGSTFRLWRNVARARLAWQLRVAPRVRAGQLVILDRFLVNYWLDPHSVRYGGSAGQLEFARRFVPKPDIMLVLDANVEVLGARKGELSMDEMREQQKRLRSLPPLSKARWDYDAATPADELARAVWDRLVNSSP